MPQHQSAVKRVRQSAKRRLQNRVKRSKLRTLIKKVLQSDNKESAEALLTEAISYLDKMTKVGIVHKNNAAHKKSQLTKHVNNL